jgi:hypothetical protein
MAREALPRGVLLLSLLLPVVFADLPPADYIPGSTVIFEDDFNGPINLGAWNVLDGYVQNAYVPFPGIPDLVCYKVRTMRRRTADPPSLVPPPPATLRRRPHPHRHLASPSPLPSPAQADDVWTESGNLVLRTRYRPTTCTGTGGIPKTYDFTSGWVDTLDRVSVQFGTIEIRAKLPPPTFRVWPAGFALSTLNRRDEAGGVCWPIATEADLYEVAGGFDAFGGLGQNALCASYHWGYTCRDDLGVARTGCLPSWRLDPAADFHVYAVELREDGLTWFVDGQVFHRMDRGTDPSIKLPPDPMYITIETGELWGGNKGREVVCACAVSLPLTQLSHPPPYPPPLAALAWWIEPRDRPTDLGPSGEARHYIDWVRVWARN